MFDVCVAVIIHNHKSVYCFGNQSLQRIWLYKFDDETHYDALVPDPSRVIIPASADPAVLSDGDGRKQTGVFMWGGVQCCMVECGCVPCAK
jgi:hypothetical protein